MYIVCRMIFGAFFAFQNQTLEKRLHEANVRIGSLEVTVRKSKLLGKELARKDKAVLTCKSFPIQYRASHVLEDWVLLT